MRRGLLQSTALRAKVLQRYHLRTVLMLPEDAFDEKNVDEKAESDPLNTLYVWYHEVR